MAIGYGKARLSSRRSVASVGVTPLGKPIVSSPHLESTRYNPCSELCQRAAEELPPFSSDPDPVTFGCIFRAIGRLFLG